MKKLSKEEVTYIKKTYLTERQRKGRHIKQCEQCGGDITFKGLDKKDYTLRYSPTGQYTNYKLDAMSHRDGIMNRGAGPLVQDKYGKINHKENNVINQLDKKLKNK
mgnify:FL=1